MATLSEENKKTIYWYLKEKLDDLEMGCSACTDIDCSNSHIYKMLEKKHKFDVIDKKACKKKMNEEAATLKKILYSPFFKQERLNECHHCKKKFERDELDFGIVSTSYLGSSEMDYFCKECIKKFKIKGFWK